MSQRARPARLLTLAASALVLLAGAPSVASAAQRLEEIDLPSTQGNVDPGSVVLNGGMTSLKATVMLPDGYDQNPTKAWPVLYLLQGIGDNSEGWAKPHTGDVTKNAKGLPAIVVMPESGRGFFTDWWQGGARSGPRWQRYFLDEVIPTIQSRYRVLPGRQNHAIAGPSMGGYGAALLGGQLPGYFGNVVSMSGLLDSQALETQSQLPQSIGAPYETVWGPANGPYASANNPMKTVANLALSRMYVSTGTGIPNPLLPLTQDAATKGAAIEAFVFVQSSHYTALAKAAGMNITLRVRDGVHSWPYWERELPLAISWNLFAAPPVTSTAAATRWSYLTMAPHGNAWGLGYQFAAPTTGITTFKRDGQLLTITGGTGTVTVNPGAADADASGNGTEPGCSFTATIPVVRMLPGGC